jgi:hypothetical protein
MSEHKILDVNTVIKPGDVFSAVTQDYFSQMQTRYETTIQFYSIENTRLQSELAAYRERERELREALEWWQETEAIIFCYKHRTEVYPNPKAKGGTYYSGKTPLEAIQNARNATERRAEL